MTINKKIPLAYFITFRTYASWLHGDKRLSVSRVRNRYNTPKINPNKNLNNQMREAQNQAPIIFSRKHGDIILTAATDICYKEDWRLYALHIRSNHVHLTVSANCQPEIVMCKIKTHATFLLRKHNEFPKNQKI